MIHSLNIPILTTSELSVAFEEKTVLHTISLKLHRNEVLGIVGETGAGKSVLARALLDLLPGKGRISGGRVLIDDRDPTQLLPEELRQFRGGKISLIGTDAKSLLDPVRPVGEQVADVLRAHKGLSAKQAKARAIEIFTQVGIVDPASRAEAYPHQLSGGMAQRVIIAMALIAEPEIILADDATLGLDATIQVQVLDLLVARCREAGMAAMIITHDLGIVARYCDRVAIMREGRIVEERETHAFLEAPSTPYGAELLGAARARPVPMTSNDDPTKGLERPIIEVINLVKHFTTSARHVVRAVDDVSFSIRPGETLALVGESGSGKTTVGQCLVRLLGSDSGSILFDGSDVLPLSHSMFRPLRRDIQMVFQEPYVALNPRWTVERLVSEPLALDPEMENAARRRERVMEMLDLVGLRADQASAFPHQLTAGEQKRVGMARALVTKPRFVVFDEPTTALDIRVRAQIIDLVRDLQSEMNLATLFITHDLNSVRSLAHRVAVMRHGKIVETGETERIFSHPENDYTKMLLSAELPIESFSR
ncbi:nickel ABC transporter ATP-binding protein NikE [Celeribacter indicus]|uniref:ABC transporter n=1 Tax=Celeribacter indicus TaxID=1208324 RepID=A0A0B5E8X5_9RHOB|nr:ABC transporter ATP-binding protein [Celeribacter indicus]AJE48767.1 ABC transporter [Celeribacter indicus]SDX11079.1 peptide/nickel transport system ATP-binding protein [Celeribacter indicus]